MRGSAYGGLSGAVVGGVAGGLQYNKQTAAFRKGNAKLGIQQPGEAVPITDDFLSQAQGAWYPDAPMDKINSFTVENVPAKIRAEMLANSTAGRTDAVRINDIFRGEILSGKSDVYFSPITFSSAKRLYFTMGHEFVHVSQVSALVGQPASLLDNNAFINMTEYHAYKYSNGVLGDPETGGFNFNIFTEDNFRQQFPRWFDRLSPTNFDWTQNVEFKYPFR